MSKRVLESLSVVVFQKAFIFCLAYVFFFLILNKKSCLQITVSGSLRSKKTCSELVAKTVYGHRQHFYSFMVLS